MSGHLGALVQSPEQPLRKVRAFPVGEVGADPLSVAYSWAADSFIVLERPQGPGSLGSVLTTVTRFEDPAGSDHVATGPLDAVTMSIDRANGSLDLLASATDELVQIPLAAGGDVEARRAWRYATQQLGIDDPRGMAIDPTTGSVFLLDAASAPRLLRVDPAAMSTGGLLGTLTSGTLSTRALDATLAGSTGLAFDPFTGHLFSLDAPGARLLELTTDGQLAAVHDLAPFALRDPRGLVIAPDADPTNAPERTSVYVLDMSGSGTGRLVELTFVDLEEQAFADQNQNAVPSVEGVLIRTVHTSNYNPPSPDPAGITYIPSLGRLLISDSEVNEMPIFGANFFEVTLAGSLKHATDSLDFSDEPTGVSYNVNDGSLFVSDDDNDEIYQVKPGGDGLFGTNDDSVTSFDTRGFGSRDPEGVGYDPDGNQVFIIDGEGREVYRVRPGSDGKFNGSGDIVTHFDVGSMGALDPEGICYNPVAHTLFISDSGSKKQVLEVSTSGSLVRVIHLDVVHPSNGSGVVYAPGSNNPGVLRLYLVDRGVDNDSNPSENDGKYYEISIGNDSVGNSPPAVNAGNDQTVLLSDGAVLGGSVNDDGLPDPPGQTTSTWTKVSGPGSASFGNSHATSTVASFSAAGVYRLRLTASDSALSSSDDVDIDVIGSGAGGGTIDRRVVASADDGEEGNSGSVSLTSSDLELVEDGNSNQTVGMRFTGLAIPQGAHVLSAWLQFKTDETGSAGTALTVRAQAANNAPAFSGSNADISSRPRTSASVPWVPAPWSTVGEQGFAQRTPDIAAVVQEVVSRPGWSPGNALAIIITGTGKRTAESYDGDHGGAPLLHVLFDTGAPTNQPPQVDAGPGQAITLPASASLDGTVTDDGLSALTTTWSKVSGPGAVTFGNSHAIDTAASFSSAGSYVLKLTADDGEFAPSDTVTIVANAAATNQPPVVDAGPDRTVALSGAASLDGTVTDDGLSALTTTWSKVSGPGVVSFGAAHAVDTSASFSVTGSYVLRLTADDGEFAPSDVMTVTVLPAGSLMSLERRVASSADDAEEKTTGSVNLTSSDLEFVHDGSEQTVGMRFTNVTIPPGSTIVSAVVQFKVDEANSSATDLTIQGQKSGNAPVFTSASGNVSSRPRTSAAVGWQPPPWTVIGQSGPDQRSPDLAAVIQEIVAQPGWSSGNALALIVTGTGERGAESFNGDAAGAPLLVVEYQ